MQVPAQVHLDEVADGVEDKEDDMRELMGREEPNVRLRIYNRTPAHPCPISTGIGGGRYQNSHALIGCYLRGSP